nr:DUF6734 family protein [Algoriphagus terrigena]
MKQVVNATGQYFGWGKPIHALISLSLSLWQLNRFYKSVLVYTDIEGKAFLDKLNCLDVEIKILPNFLPATGTLDKLYACSEQAEPFVHVDSDVFIQTKLTISTSSDFLLVQHNNFEVSRAHMIAIDLAEESGNEAGEVTGNFCFDTSLLGGSHGLFFRAYLNGINGSIPMLNLSKLRDTELRFWIYSVQLAKFAEEQRMAIKFHHGLPTELQYPFLVSQRLVAHSYCKLHDALKQDPVTVEALYRVYYGCSSAFVDEVMSSAYGFGIDPMVRPDAPSYIRASKALVATGLLDNTEVVDVQAILDLLDHESQSQMYHPLLKDVYQFEKHRSIFIKEQRLTNRSQAKILPNLPTEDKDQMLKTILARADNISLIESKWDWAVQQCDLNEFSELKIRYNLAENAGEHVTLLKYDPTFDSLEEINLLNVLDIALLDTLTKPRAVGDLIAEVYGMFVKAGDIQQNLLTAFEQLAVKRIAYFVAQQYFLVIKQ